MDFSKYEQLNGLGIVKNVFALHMSLGLNTFLFTNKHGTIFPTRLKHVCYLIHNYE